MLVRQQQRWHCLSEASLPPQVEHYNWLMSAVRAWAVSLVRFFDDKEMNIKWPFNLFAPNCIIWCKKNHSVCVSSGSCFLHPNGLFSVYYLGVYMILGLLVLLFSVSATLKVCTIIIAHKNLKSSILF